VIVNFIRKFKKTEVVLFGFGLIGFLISIVSLTKAGFGWDATFHTVSAKSMRQVQSGMSLQEAYDLIPYTDEFYGVLLHWLADFLHWIVTGNSPLDSENYLAYYWQGTINLLMLISSTLICAYSVSKVLQERAYFFVVWASLGLTPLWIGTGHTDFKDLPVAAGITIFSSGLILALHSLSQSIPGRKKNPKRNKPHSKTQKSAVAVNSPRGNILFSPMWLFIAFGTFVSLGSRAGSIAILGVVLTLSIFSGIIVQNFSKNTRAQFGYFLKRLVLSFSTGLLLLFILNPIARINMPVWLFDSVKIANSYPWVGPVRTAGKQLMSDNLPWWYIPSWYLVSLPTLFLTLTFVAVLIILYKLTLKRDKEFLLRILIFSPLVAQGFVVPFLMNISGTILYDGIRHVLFIVPALIVLTIVSFSLIEYKNLFLTVRKPLITMAAVAVFSITLGEISRWVPYEYAHKNALHNLGGQKINWEMDYWGVSTREGTDKLLNKYGLTEAIILPSGEMASAFGAASITEINGDQITLAGDHRLDRYFGVYLFNRFTWSETADLPLNDCKDAPLAKCTNMIPPKCEVLFEIIHANVVLGKGAVCQNPSIKEEPNFSQFLNK
jgi:hypothetical protein